MAGRAVSRYKKGGKSGRRGLAVERGRQSGPIGVGVRLAVVCPAGHPAGSCLRRSPVFAAQAEFKRAKDKKVLSPIGENGAVCCRKMQQFGREWKVFEEVLCFAQLTERNARVDRAV